MIKLYGHPASTCTRKVLATLAETGTPYEMVVVDFATGEHKKEPHLSRQPFGKVPALDDDGFQMYESRAMCRYLNAKAGGKLVPSDARGLALMEQWISFETSYFTSPVMKFVYQHIFGRAQEPAVLEQASAELDHVLKLMDARLGQSAYLAGDAFTLADICFLPYIEYAMATPLKEKFSGFSNVMTWWNRCSERPSWRKATGKV